MPFTPYHFGPGLLFKGIAPKHFSWTGFVVAQIVIDSEVLYSIVRQQYPLHRTFHTLIGASIAGIISTFLIIGLYWLVTRTAVNSPLRCNQFWTSIRTEFSSTSGVLIGGIIGGITHVLFDSLIYPDVKPFWPLFETNPFLGFVNSNTLVTSMMVFGLIGAIFVCLWLYSESRAG